MAISFDASATGSVSSNTTLTFSHTVGAGSNRILWVAFLVNDAAPAAVSSVTYNGVAMTATVDSPFVEQATIYQHLFYLVAPASGAHNVVITMASSMSGINAHAVSYAGAKQTGVPDAHATGTGTGTTGTMTATTVADNSWLVGFFRNEAAGNGTAGGGTTQRTSIVGNSSFDDSGGAKTPAGSYSVTETFSNALWGAIGASFAPSVAAASTGGFLGTFM